ncbi:nitrous-oxide reductase [Sinimarinibacterium sp. CAU 1509]|uniref:TAT-dependent nitrous-oxide reductase n=1 Tax=Sinimarinibacterium sp. CAU 1509 TaxID=2562283 RepID=UPI0010AB6DCA|nr:TAT-dependent nitrous-oxide reductase [Sinimarinibacterium sp. CAU 1509]TJY56256.1 nitrous-oxide reductase [Sinimarinibacterium sp. CAU 1509]
MTVQAAPADSDAPTVDRSRRHFLETAGLAGVATVGLPFALSACRQPDAPDMPQNLATAATSLPKRHEISPGQLDEYYGLWSGGHSGEVRVLGMPSGREIKRIPVFNRCAMSGWGQTNESKAILGTRADGTMKYTTGDTHHVHASYTDGTYDGKYAWVNEKIHGRIARIRLDTFECDKITEIPHIQGFHGIFPDKRDPVKAEVNHTTRVFCGSEFAIPQPNDGRDLDDPTKYYSVFSCVDAETMEVRWQCKVKGNMDLVATSFSGKLAAANQYNVENGAMLADMMSAERDACVFFNVARIEQAISDGRFYTLSDSKVPIVDGTPEKNTDPKTALTAYVPVPKNPHGVNASPDGKYFICAGKLSPTATVIDVAAVERWFEGEVPEIAQTIVAEVELGLGPLHTAFDGRGNAFTTLFLDSQIVKWNVEKAIAFYKGDNNAAYVVDRLDVMYQPGHLNASMSETREADGKWLITGCKFSKDRFLPVGPLHPENEQIIDISGEKMQLIADHPVWPEPHDFIVMRRDIVKPRQIYDLAEFPNAVKESRVVREGRKVTVHLISVAPSFSLPEVRVKKGDEVTVILTNMDKVEDLTHGFALPKYDVNFIVNPQETKSVTFKADKPGVYWFYCSHFCHALHLEMRSRLLVEA